MWYKISGITRGLIPKWRLSFLIKHIISEDSPFFNFYWPQNPVKHSALLLFSLAAYQTNKSFIFFPNTSHNQCHQVKKSILFLQWYKYVLLISNIIRRKTYFCRCYRRVGIRQAGIQFWVHAIVYSHQSAKRLVGQVFPIIFQLGREIPEPGFDE